MYICIYVSMYIYVYVYMIIPSSVLLCLVSLCQIHHLIIYEYNISSLVICTRNLSNQIKINCKNTAQPPKIMFPVSHIQIGIMEPFTIFFSIPPFNGFLRKFTMTSLVQGRSPSNARASCFTTRSLK